MLFDSCRQEIFDQIKLALGADLPADVNLEIPPEMKMGDFAFPTFKLAKALRKAPPVIAKELHEKLSANPALTAKYDMVMAGPYVNFSLKRDVLLKDVLGSLLLSGDSLAEKKIDKPPVAILEFSSPNVAKPFNIYHLRGTMIGNSLYRVYKARGFNTISINHLGDWGTQYGTLAVAYEMWGNDADLDKGGIEYLVGLYVRINKELETNAELKTKTREYFARLEKGDPSIQEYWRKFLELSIREFKITYGRLNVHFDHYWGESMYVDKTDKLIKVLKDKELMVESEGAQVVKLDDYNMPPCIILKADGSTIYHTRDLAAAIYRYEQFHFDRMVYVVGQEQKLHFRQLFKTLELAGFDWASKCTHVDFGLYRFKDAKMSTRKGNYVTLEAVLDHAVERVQQIMADKNSAMSEDERARAAEIIGVGAVIFNDLSTDRNTDVNFDLEKVLDFEGETGPYIQYAHTRCLGILRNAPAELTGGIEVSKLLDLAAPQPAFTKLFTAAQAKLKEPEELDLIRMLAKLPMVLDQVVDTHRPSTLATYVIDITKVFNQFYRAHKVLVEDAELARARLALVLATQRTLLKGLSLLGMRVPERM